MYLYLAEEDVRKDKIKSGTIKMNDENNPFNWVDLLAAGPGTIISWTSSYSQTGVLGDAELATKEKGERACNEAVKQLCAFVEYFQRRPIDVRKKHQRPLPTMPIPWNQRDSE
jgi:creatinine amidohydrolase